MLTGGTGTTYDIVTGSSVFARKHWRWVKRSSRTRTRANLTLPLMPPPHQAAGEFLRFWPSIAVHEQVHSVHCPGTRCASVPRCDLLLKLDSLTHSFWCLIPVLNFRNPSIACACPWCVAGLVVNANRYCVVYLMWHCICCHFLCITTVIQGSIHNTSEWKEQFSFYTFDIPIQGTCQYELQHCVR